MTLFIPSAQFIVDKAKTNACCCVKTRNVANVKEALTVSSGNVNIQFAFKEPYI